MTVAVRALSIGEAVPPCDFAGAVHSVFKKAANIQGTSEGLLLTLLGAQEADLPQGIRLEATDGFALADLEIGASANCRDGMLAVGDALIVDLGQASTWKCDLSALEADMADPAVASAWREAWQALRERRLRLGLDAPRGPDREQDLKLQSVFEEQLEKKMQAVVSATEHFDLDAAANICDLVGLGSGLTPAGDDILTGYLAGLRCAVRGKLERREFLAAVAELVVRYSKQTNDISRTYLCLAARGQVSIRLVELAGAVCEGADPARVATAASAAMQVGHTSGMESVKGLLLGLAAWDGADLLASEAYETVENASRQAARTPSPDRGIMFENRKPAAD